jgi:hypothetical protein
MTLTGLDNGAEMRTTVETTGLLALTVHTPLDGQDTAVPWDRPPIRTPAIFGVRGRTRERIMPQRVPTMPRANRAAVVVAQHRRNGAKREVSDRTRAGALTPTSRGSNVAGRLSCVTTGLSR